MKFISLIELILVKDLNVIFPGTPSFTITSSAVGFAQNSIVKLLLTLATCVVLPKSSTPPNCK